MEEAKLHMPNTNLQNIFYLVGIVTMSLMTILFFVLIVALFYIRAKIGEVVTVIEKRLKEVKSIVGNPQKMANTVGEAIIDTAVNQVSKMTGNGKQRKRRYSRA